MRLKLTNKLLEIIPASIAGLDIAVESPKGSLRHGKDWIQKMYHDYGYIEGTMGADGDEMDVFVGPNLDSESLFIVEQVKEDGKFDEHKVMLGFSNISEATEAYKVNYPEGWNGMKNISEIPVSEFWGWHDNLYKENTMPTDEKKNEKESSKENSLNTQDRVNWTVSRLARGSDRYASKENKK